MMKRSKTQRTFSLLILNWFYLFMNEKLIIERNGRRIFIIWQQVWFDENISSCNILIHYKIE